MSIRRGIVVTLKLALAIGLLAWLLWSGRLDFRVLSTAQANWHWLAAAFILSGVIQWMTAVRWRWLLLVVGQGCTRSRAFLITLAGLLFNQVLIGSTGGDIYRVMAFDVDNARQRIAIAVSVGMDRLVGLFALVVLIPVAALWNFSLVSQSELLTVITVGGAGATIGLPAISWAIYRRGSVELASNPPAGNQSRVVRWIRYLRDGLALFSGHWPIVVSAMVLSLLVQVLIVTVNVFLVFSILGTGIQWSAMFLLIPVALLAMAIPINPPGAIGTGEAVYSVLLELAGIAQGSIISLLQRLINVVWALPGSLAIFVRPNSRSLSIGNNSEELTGQENPND